MGSTPGVQIVKYAVIGNHLIHLHYKVSGTGSIAPLVIFSSSN